MNSVVKLEHKDVDAIPFQEASLDIWDKKYRLSAKDGTPVDKTMDDTYKRVARALADVELEPVRELWYERFVWALRRGAIPAGRVTSQRRRARAQARHVHHQLHGVRNHRRLDGRHPEQGARGRPHAEGRLRHRLRILDAASARRVRVRRRRVHVRPAVVHGYLRQDVFHRVVGRRPPRCADGHVRRRPPRRHGIHPRQARERPPAPVQPVAARHRRFHESRSRRQGLEPGLPAAHEGIRPGRAQARRRDQVPVARMAHHGKIRHARRRPRLLQDLQDAAGAPHVGRHHDVHLRLRRAGLHPHRPRQ